MERIEYRGYVDKSEWGPGPWQDEPDKVQWQDEATRLPCLIVRGPHGGFCGYVGVMPGHPLHGKDYSECPEYCGKDWCDHRPESRLDAHGGITFASACAHIGDEEHWRQFCTRILAGRDEAKRYPQGDAAMALKEWAAGLESYDAWAERMRATRVCHVPAAGESDNVWWFGFDCAHSGDLCPSYARKFRGGIDEDYRDIAYVTEQCSALARQLFAMTTAPLKSQ